MKKDRPKTLVYRKGESRMDNGYGDRERPQLFPVTCDNCGRKTEVPFKPTGDKPVFCRDCFNNQGGSERGSRGRGFGGHKPHGGSNNDLEGIERRLKRIEDKIDELLASI